MAVVLAIGALAPAARAQVPRPPPVGGPVVMREHKVLREEREEDPDDAALREPSPPPAKSNRKMGIVGGILFGTTYLISIAAGSASLASRTAKLPELYIPLAGPWIAVPDIIAIDKRAKIEDPSGHQLDYMKPVGLGLLGIGQALGALCIVGYLVDRPSEPDRPSKIAAPRVTPYFDGTSLGVVGTF